MAKMFQVTLQRIAGDTDSEFCINVPASHWQDAFDMAQSEYDESPVVYVQELKPFKRED